MMQLLILFRTTRREFDAEFGEGAANADATFTAFGLLGALAIGALILAISGD